MKISYFILFLIAIGNLGCNSTRYNLTVYFLVDDKELNITNDFKMYFLENNHKIEAKVQDDHLKLPNFSKDTVTAIFTYKDYKLEFKGMEVDRLRLKQNMNWTFKVLNANFDQLALSLNLGRVKKVYVWEFHPLDHGDGIDITVPVYK